MTQKKNDHFLIKILGGLVAAVVAFFAFEKFASETKGKKKGKKK